MTSAFQQLADPSEGTAGTNSHAGVYWQADPAWKVCSLREGEYCHEADEHCSGQVFSKEIALSKELQKEDVLPLRNRS